MIETRRHDRVVRIDRRAVIGAAWRFDDELTHVIHRTVESHHPAAFSLPVKTHAVPCALDAHLELLRCYYNFVRPPHGALKFGRETRTPAMQAGLATRRLTIWDIFVSMRSRVSLPNDVLGVRRLAQDGSCRCHEHAGRGVTTLDGRSTALADATALEVLYSRISVIPHLNVVNTLVGNRKTVAL